MAIDWVAVGGWLFSVVTAVIAYMAATRKYTQTTKDSDKTVYVTAVTNERAKWRDELRRNVAEYSMLSIEPSTRLPELQRVKAEIILRLNPRAKDPGLAEKHKFDLLIINSVNDIFLTLTGKTTCDISKLIADLETAAQEMLKQEWEKSKAEALSGKTDTKPCL
jgi:hypothetical protein